MGLFIFKCYRIKTFLKLRKKKSSLDSFSKNKTLLEFEHSSLVLHQLNQLLTVLCFCRFFVINSKLYNT